MTATRTDRIPPSSPDAERGVLGCLLLDAVRCMFLGQQAGLTADWFMDRDLRQLFVMLEDAFAVDPQRCDLLTVREEARRRGMEAVITPELLQSLVDATPTTTHAEFYLGALRQTWLRRKLIVKGGELIEAAHDETNEVEAELARLQAELFELQESHDRKRPVAQVYADILASWNNKNDALRRGLPSRWKGLRELLGGYRPGKICIVAALPGKGKSTFMANECLSLANGGVPVSIASIEMSEDELRGRMLAESADVSSFKLDIGNGDLQDFGKVNERVPHHEKLPIRIEDASMTIENLCAWMTREVVAHGARFLAVDYLQIISESGRRESRNATVSHWMDVLRETTKRLNVPLMLLSQLSRSKEGIKRTAEGSDNQHKKPDLQDLRDSGTIEQNGYSVIFIHESADGTQFLLSKNRGGPTGIVPVKFVRGRQRFEEPPAFGDRE